VDADGDQGSLCLLAAQDVELPSASIAPDSNRRAWSAAVNLFYSPVSNFDIGTEYRHGERETASGQEGVPDRLQFIAKRSF
jgi:hypothetical protein